MSTARDRQPLATGSLYYIRAGKNEALAWRFINTLIDRQA